MTEITWAQLVALAFGSSVLVKVLDILYQEVLRARAKRKSAEEVTDQHVFPFLKAADELLGKLHTVANKDFKPIQGITPNEKCLSNADFGSLVYLFGMFWSRVETLRQALSVTMANEKRGKEIQAFFDCLEAPRVRLVETIQQRAVGEMLVEDKEVRGFTAFVAAFEKDGDLRRWIEPLVKVLSRTRHTRERQLLLQYATVLHALVDTLDPKHLATSDRPPLSKKLNGQSWQHLNYGVFGQYLKFVKGPQKYLGPPKKSSPVMGKAAL